MTRRLPTAFALLALASLASAKNDPGSEDRSAALARELNRAVVVQATDATIADRFAQTARAWASHPETTPADYSRLKTAVRQTRNLLSAPAVSVETGDFADLAQELEPVIGKAAATKLVGNLQSSMFQEIMRLFAASRRAGSTPVNGKPFHYRGRTYGWAWHENKPIVARWGSPLQAADGIPHRAFLDRLPPEDRRDAEAAIHEQIRERMDRAGSSSSANASRGSTSAGSTSRGSTSAGSTSAGSTSSGSTSSGSTSSGRTSRRSSGRTPIDPPKIYLADHPWSQPPTGDVDPRKLDGLDPSFRVKVIRILQRLQQKGWQPRVGSGRRTLAQQKEKVRKGYSKTLKSWHLKGLAADIIDSRWGWGGPAANLNHPFWNDLRDAVALEGLTWGGNFKNFKDVAHVQDSN